MTLGDLLSGVMGKAQAVFGTGDVPKPTTANLPQLQAMYQRYAEDAMTRGQSPMPFQQWVVVQQQASSGQQ